MTTIRNAMVMAVNGVDGGDSRSPRSFAERLVAAGALLTQAGDGLAVLHRFDGSCAGLLLEAARMLRWPDYGALRVGASVAVRISLEGRILPSESSVKAARTLAAQAPVGRVVLALRLATMLQLTEHALTPFMQPLEAAAGQAADMDAMVIDVDGGSTTSAASFVSLDTRRRAHLVERLSERLLEDLGPIASILVEQVCGSAQSSADVVDGLAPYMSKLGAQRLEAVVAEEVRLLVLRGR